MTPAEQRKLAMDYAEDVAIKCPIPIDKIEIADHFLTGLRKGLSVSLQFQYDRATSRPISDKRDLPAHARV